jgi:hypothetical protein
MKLHIGNMPNMPISKCILGLIAMEIFLLIGVMKYTIGGQISS